uniref:Uncharacterized protein n=1 Tax=Ditylenchus dipsaci TaxID=166011 RepID=A0A915D1Z1_9BILA
MQEEGTGKSRVGMGIGGWPASYCSRSSAPSASQKKVKSLHPPAAMDSRGVQPAINTATGQPAALRLTGGGGNGRRGD